MNKETIELAEIMEKTQSQLTVLYHILFWGATEEYLISEISMIYNGKVIAGKDLDIY